VSLDCSLLISSSVFSNVYVRFNKGVLRLFIIGYLSTSITIVLLRDAFHIGLVTGPRPAVLT
jgi:hypothetical protein